MGFEIGYAMQCVDIGRDETIWDSPCFVPAPGAFVVVPGKVATELDVEIVLVISIGLTLKNFGAVLFDNDETRCGYKNRTNVERGETEQSIW